MAGDASDHEEDVAVSHFRPDGTEHPLIFLPELSSAKHNYVRVEKEALSLIFSIHNFHPFLKGPTFTIINNHKPLTIILTPKQGIPTLSAARIQRWALLLSAYSCMEMRMDCHICH